MTLDKNDLLTNEVTDDTSTVHSTGTSNHDTTTAMDNALSPTKPLHRRRRLALLWGAAAATVAASIVTWSSVVRQSVPLIRTAFLGNSLTYVNDLPRLLEGLSDGTIVQDSCLHGNLDLARQLQRGNGMYNMWRTEAAYVTMVEMVEQQDAQGDDDAAAAANDDAEAKDNNDDATETAYHAIYDFGACSLRQLLTGSDAALGDGVTYEQYADGTNPCLEDAYYLEYRLALDNDEEEQQKDSLRRDDWDYVILNDLTIAPAHPQKRQQSLTSLTTDYTDLLEEMAAPAIPVFLSTYGYDKTLYTSNDDGNNAGNDDANGGNDDGNVHDDDSGQDWSLGDIPEFTSRVWYGYHQYATALQNSLGRPTLVAPTGLAFLLVHQENYDVWTQLFYDDGFHPSPHGTFLLGTCLYATLYGRMPSTLAIADDPSVLFDRARRFHSDDMGDDRPLPTADEALYLTGIAKRACLNMEQPSSLLSMEAVAAMEAYETAASSSYDDDNYANDDVNKNDDGNNNNEDDNIDNNNEDDDNNE